MRRFLIAIAFAAVTAGASEVLDNAAIIRMTQAGLPADVILVKIDQTEGRFDTSTDALIALKKSGVADAVIKGMMLRPAAPATPPIPVPSEQPLPPSGETCARLEWYTLGNNGWGWVPAGVCVSRDALSIDEQPFRFADLVVQCIEPPARFSVLGVSGSSTDSTWRIGDANDSYEIRGKADDIRRLSDALTSAAPAVRHGNCSDREVRALLKKTPRAH